VEILRKAGAGNINTDIMLGLPGQTAKDVKDTLDLLESLDIPHVSAYGLKCEEGTRLYEKVKSGQIALPDDDTCADFYDMAVNALKKRGIRRYEVSNFAAKGYECRHNLNYWKRGEYIGAGASAHSFLGGMRWENISDIGEYIKRSGLNCAVNKNMISPEDAEFEYIFLGLRLTEGINKENFKKLFNVDFEDKYGEILNKYQSFFNVKGENVRIKSKGFGVLNSLLSEFAPQAQKMS
jgi:oxygen-independent coproporphyrinogen-3 oxidase